MPEKKIEIPFEDIAASAYRVSQNVHGIHEYTAFGDLPVLDQCAWEAVVRHVLTLADHDETEGQPNLSHYEGFYLAGWMPKRLRDAG